MSKLTFSKILISKDTALSYYVNIRILAKEQCQLLFPTSLVRGLELDGQIIEFLAETSKKMLGFRILPKVNKEDWKKDTFRLIKPNSVGVAQLGIGKLLNSIRVEKKNYKRIPLKRHEDSTYGEIFYIDFTNTNLK